MHAYEDMIQHTATDEAPWYVVPADHNGSRGWSSPARSSTRSKTSNSTYPAVDAHKREELRLVQAELERNGDEPKAKKKGKKDGTPKAKVAKATPKAKSASPRKARTPATDVVAKPPAPAA